MVEITFKCYFSKCKKINWLKSVMMIQKSFPKRSQNHHSIFERVKIQSVGVLVNIYFLHLFYPKSLTMPQLMVLMGSHKNVKKMEWSTQRDLVMHVYSMLMQSYNTSSYCCSIGLLSIKTFIMLVYLLTILTHIFYSQAHRVWARKLKKVQTKKLAKSISRFFLIFSMKIKFLIFMENIQF